MIINSPLLQDLIHNLRILPGIGQKTAQKMALNLLEHKKDKASDLANAILNAIANIDYCTKCRSLSETEICEICADEERNQEILCVLESPLDIYSFEQASFNGLYFVLKGHLSPLDGIDASKIGIDALLKRIDELNLNEIIIAMHETIEGEATSYYISQLLRDKNIKITRLAKGVPTGAEFENIDGNTLLHALQGRKQINNE